MRSLARLRLPLAALALAALTAAGAQLAHLSYAIPSEEVLMAWTLAKLLIQL